MVETLCEAAAAIREACDGSASHSCTMPVMVHPLYPGALSTASVT